ncbi:hypothetical protein [Clostridioides sp. ZZV14-6153]|uniref:hypothetical protein n=1 Tax=Clostridioides sp. ZZV14-6153 TaxID=2811494 RepID=UPI001D105BE2|nr:hypothetical protein [Clostridioides sp. ZZV14-6153]
MQLIINFKNIDEYMDFSKKWDYPYVDVRESDNKVKDKEVFKKNDFSNNKVDIPKHLIYNYDNEIWAGKKMKMAKMAKENNYSLFMFNYMIYFVDDKYEYYRIGSRD